MPLPLLVAVPALVSAAGAGTLKGAGGIRKLRDAKEFDQVARDRYERAASLLGQEEDKARFTLATLADERRKIFAETMPQFVSVLDRLRHAEVAAEAFEDHLAVDEIPPGELRDVMLRQIELVGTAAAGAIGAIAAGGATPLAVGTFAAASTGTAISSLSGAAATNATLAWLGGGSLAAGGAGMAGGTMVLAGTAVAPALLIGGLLFDRKATKLLASAQGNAEQVRSVALKMDVSRARVRSILRASEQAVEVIRGLTAALLVDIGRLDSYADEADDIAAWPPDRQQRLQAVANAAGLLVAVGAMPLLADDGRVDSRFRDVVRSADA